MPKSDMQNPANIYDTCIHKRLDILLHGQLVYIGLITHYVRSIQKMHVCATITYNYKCFKDTIQEDL